MTAQSPVEQLIAAENYWVVPGDAVVVCALTLKNDYTVIGHAGCVNPDEFDEKIGRDLARKDAIANIWPLIGFEMASRRKWLATNSADQIEENLNGLA